YCARSSIYYYGSSYGDYFDY
nr:immunoglobulin heavy chain junction region [Mus musculus]